MTYYVPRGGLPPQTALTTDRATFTEAYAVIPARTLSDITASLPARLGRAPGCGCWPGRCAASPRRSASTSSRSRPAAAPTSPRSTRRPRACCSWSTAR